MSTAARVALGFRACRGGSTVVGVSLGDDDIRLALSTFLATAAADDRLAFEPYHVAAEMARDPSGDIPIEIVSAGAEGRRRQVEQAGKGLEAILRQVRDGAGEPVVAALLVNRAGWVTDLLHYSLSMPDHPPVAEGLAVREALRSAFGQFDIRVTEMDEKSLPETASAVIGLSPARLEARLKALGATAGKPWRKEQKLACLAAWLALVAS